MLHLGLKTLHQLMLIKLSFQVAFLARLSDHFGPSTVTTHVLFSQVDFNLGSGFDPATGSFLVDVDGVYVFHLQVMAMADHIAWLTIKVSYILYI